MCSKEYYSFHKHVKSVRRYMCVGLMAVMLRNVSINFKLIKLWPVERSAASIFRIGFFSERVYFYAAVE
jgi:hypothetical protein